MLGPGVGKIVYKFGEKYVVSPKLLSVFRHWAAKYTVEPRTLRGGLSHDRGIFLRETSSLFGGFTSRLSYLSFVRLQEDRFTW